MSRAVQRSDDRARCMMTKTTRKDKPGRENEGNERRARRRRRQMNRQREKEEVKADLGLMDDCVFRYMSDVQG